MSNQQHSAAVSMENLSHPEEANVKRKHSFDHLIFFFFIIILLHQSGTRRKCRDNKSGNSLPNQCNVDSLYHFHIYFYGDCSDKLTPFLLRVHKCKRSTRWAVRPHYFTLNFQDVTVSYLLILSFLAPFIQTTIFKKT